MNKGIDDYIAKLEKGEEIYKSKRGGSFTFIKYVDGKLYFAIPNRKDPIKVYVKIIKIEVLYFYAELKSENVQFERNEAPFLDCRWSVLKEIILCKI